MCLISACHDAELGPVLWHRHDEVGVVCILKIRLLVVTHCRSAAVIKYETGPIPDPWMMLAFTTAKVEHSLHISYSGDGLGKILHFFELETAAILCCHSLLYSSSSVCSRAIVLQKGLATRRILLQWSVFCHFPQTNNEFHGAVMAASTYPLNIELNQVFKQHKKHWYINLHLVCQFTVILMTSNVCNATQNQKDRTRGRSLARAIHAGSL